MLNDKFPEFSWKNRDISVMFLSDSEGFRGIGFKTKDGEPQEGTVILCSLEQATELVNSFKEIIKEL